MKDGLKKIKDWEERRIEIGYKGYRRWKDKKRIKSEKELKIYYSRKKRIDESKEWMRKNGKG